MKNHRAWALFCFALAGVGTAYAAYLFYGWGLAIVAFVIVGLAAWEAVWKK